MGILCRNGNKVTDECTFFLFARKRFVYTGLCVNIRKKKADSILSYGRLKNLPIKFVYVPNSRMNLGNISMQYIIKRNALELLANCIRIAEGVVVLWQFNFICGNLVEWGVYYGGKLLLGFVGGASAQRACDLTDKHTRQSHPNIPGGLPFFIALTRFPPRVTVLPDFSHITPIFSPYSSHISDLFLPYFSIFLQYFSR